MPLELREAFVVSLLHKELVSFVIDDTLELREIQGAVARNEPVLEVAWHRDQDVT